MGGGAEVSHGEEGANPKVLSSMWERLRTVDSLKGGRDSADDILDALGTISEAKMGEERGKLPGELSGYSENLRFVGEITIQS